MTIDSVTSFIRRRGRCDADLVRALLRRSLAASRTYAGGQRSTLAGRSRQFVTCARSDAAAAPTRTTHLHAVRPDIAPGELAELRPDATITAASVSLDAQRPLQTVRLLIEERRHDQSKVK